MSERQEAQKSEREERIPFGASRTKLQLSRVDNAAMKESGYTPRWINDVDGRIPAAKAGGYVHVMASEVPSMGSAASDVGQQDTGLGAAVSKVVSKESLGGTPIRAFLMKIQKEFYDADQAEKEKVNAKVDEDLRAVKDGGQTIEGGYTPT